MSPPKKKAGVTSLLEDFLVVAAEAAESEFGTEKCFNAAQLEEKIKVVHIPSLSLRWLLSINGWPLSRFTQAGGNRGTFKSSFAFQLLQWFLDAGGVGLHIDSENKTSPTLMWSVLADEYGPNGTPALQSRVRFQYADSINEWQRMLTQTKSSIDTATQNHGGAKPDFPILWTVDSLLGAGSTESGERIQKEGEAQGRGYKDDPILLKNFFQTFPSMLREWPITLHAVHHEKETMTGGVTWGGGRAPEFYSSLALRFRLSRGKTAYGVSEKVNRAQLKGHTIGISIRKSSVGPDVGRELSVPFLWTFEDDPVTGVARQKSWWDWDAATAMVLEADKGLEKATGLDVHPVSKQSGIHFWSKALGISEKTPEPASVFGRLVDTSPTWLAALDKHYNIHQYKCVGKVPEYATPENHKDGAKSDV